MSNCNKRGFRRDLDYKHDAGEELDGGSLAEGCAGKVQVQREFNPHKAYRRKGEDVSMEKWNNSVGLPSKDAGY